MELFFNGKGSKEKEFQGKQAHDIEENVPRVDDAFKKIPLDQLNAARDLWARRKNSDRTRQNPAGGGAAWVWLGTRR